MLVLAYIINFRPLLSECKRDHPGHPSADRLQLWSGREKTGRKNIPDGTGTGAWCDGSRNADILAHPGKIDRAVHRE